MGLFGFFATMVGLGAMAKDGIERSVSSSNAYNKAIANKDDWYFTGNGAQMKSTKTGRECYTEKDYKTGHWLVKDLKMEDQVIYSSFKGTVRSHPGLCYFCSSVIIKSDFEYC